MKYIPRYNFANFQYYFFSCTVLVSPNDKLFFETISTYKLFGKRYLVTLMYLKFSHILSGVFLTHVIVDSFLHFLNKIFS